MHIDNDISCDSDLEMPKFIEEGWDVYDEETGRWSVAEDAPEWAKKEAEEYYALLYSKPDDNGIVTQY